MSDCQCLQQCALKTHYTQQDKNKLLLLGNKAFIPFLLDGLFLSPPTDSRTAGSVPTMMLLQTLFAECIAQLALFTPGKDALLQNGSVLKVLRLLVETGWSEEAKDSGRAALLALSDKETTAGRVIHSEQANKHIMMSCTTVVDLICVLCVYILFVLAD